MLWNRSLVMMDLETKSLWSHILGQAMSGSLQGTQLESLPGDMVTWEAWRREHPDTTVLNLPRTNLSYTKQFYRRPETFVLGFEAAGRFYHCSFAALRQRPLGNLDVRGEKLLVAFDPDTTSARLFSRRLGDRELTFERPESGQMRDRQTGSLWNRMTGEAIEGPLRGRRLDQRVAIVSYTHAWLIFHPETDEVANGSDF
jgi:hypothetical protein